MTDDLIAKVKTFVETRLIPVIEEFEEREEVPLELVKEMGSLGLFGMITPREWGGMGLTTRQYVDVLIELERGGGSLRSIVSISNSLVASPLNRFATDAQKQRFLRPIATGEALPAFALSEPDAGSNPAEMTTTATRTADGWLLNGTKMWIGNACHAGVLLVFAKTNPEAGARGITAFIVERGDGLRAEALRGKLSLRAANPSRIEFRDFHVTDDNVLGPIDGGFKIAMWTIDTGRISVAAAGLGAAHYALELALDYSRRRRQFGKPIGAHQLVQNLLAEMHVDVEAGRGLLDRAIRAKESRERFTEEAATAKLFCTEAANRNAYRAVQVFGGQGILEKNHVARIYRDARVLTLYEGTSEVLKLVLGHHLTGLKAFGN